MTKTKTQRKIENNVSAHMQGWNQSQPRRRPEAIQARRYGREVDGALEEVEKKHRNRLLGSEQIRATGGKFNGALENEWCTLAESAGN